MFRASLYEGKQASYFLTSKKQQSDEIKVYFVVYGVYWIFSLYLRADRVFAITYKIAKMTWQCLRLMQIPVSCKFPRRTSRDRQSSIFYDARTYNADKRP